MRKPNRELRNYFRKGFHHELLGQWYETGRITLPTYLELEKKLPQHVWQHFPNDWPGYVRNLVFLFENFYKTPLAGWRSSSFLEPLTNALTANPALIARLPPSFQAQVQRGLQASNLDEKGYRALYALWLNTLEPLKYRPLQVCSEGVSRGRFPLPPGGDSRTCDRFYDAMRHRFEEHVLASERSDLWVVNLGYGPFDHDERFEDGNYQETWTVRARVTPGSAQQNWWFFVQPQGTGFVACWPVVSLSGRAISWTVYLAACVDRTWEVTRWFDELGAMDKWNLKHLKPLRAGKDGPVQKTNWRGHRVPIPGEDNFPHLEHSGWTVVAARFEERHRVETDQAKSLEMFVSEMMSRTAADFSTLTHLNDFGPQGGNGLDQGSPKGSPSGRAQDGAFRNGNPYRPSAPPRRPAAQWKPDHDVFDDGDDDDNRYDYHGDRTGNPVDGTPVQDGVKQKWTRDRNDVHGPRGAYPPQDRTNMNTREAASPLDVFGVFAADMMMPDNKRAAMQSICDALRGHTSYAHLVDQLLDARTEKDIRLLRLAVGKALSEEQPARSGTWHRQPKAEYSSVRRDLDQLAMYLQFSSVSDAITTHGLRKWLN